jgi:hypothetical protein
LVAPARRTALIVCGLAASGSDPAVWTKRIAAAPTTGVALLTTPGGATRSGLTRPAPATVVSPDPFDPLVVPTAIELYPLPSRSATGPGVFAPAPTTTT